MDKIRCVVAGCGGYSGYFVPPLAQHAAFTLVGLADPARERSHSLRERLGRPTLPIFNSLQEALIETQPELVFVHSPLTAHYANCREALEAGCYVSVAKPFVNAIAEALELIALSRATGRFISVQQSARLGRAERIKQWLEDGTVGTPRFAHHYTYRERWRNLADYQKTETWPVINATLIHLVDQMRYWTGDDFTAACFRGISVPWNPYRDPGVAVGWMTTASGFTLSLFQSYVSKVCTAASHHPYEHYHIQGDEAALMWTGPWGAGPILLSSPQEAEPRVLLATGDDFSEVVRTYLDKLAAAVRGEGPVFCPAEDNIKTLAAMKAAELSAIRGGATVTVAEALES